MANSGAGFFPGPENPSNETNMANTLLHNNAISQNQAAVHNNADPMANVSRSEGSVNAFQQVQESVGSTFAKIFVPMVSDSLKPKLGMQFETIEEAYNFYNLYAREAGFSVRRHSDKKNVKGYITHKSFVCNRQGHTDNKASESGLPLKRLVPETRIGCLACMSLKRNEVGSTYIVRVFVEEHCHPLATLTKSRLLRSHRKATNTKKKSIDGFDSSNLQPSQQMTVFEEQNRGYENIGFIDKDVHNYTRDGREETNGLDAQMLHDYFEDKAEQNPSFVYSIRKDNADRITHVFWADNISRSNYNRFGNVVSFDTMYKTNRYDMLFASFTGVNHHSQHVVLGCGFLLRETTDDFVWLLEEWQKAMSSDPPKCIITDQDPGVTKAIAQVFPHATHSYCIWHIMDNASKYLGSTAFKPEFSKEFKRVVYSAETPLEFESMWPIFLQDHELTEHQWLRDLYELRAKWIPAYLRDKFFAGMRNIQRSETINKILKQYVHMNNSFCDFILRYERFIGRQRHCELRDDHETFNTKPRMRTPFPFEEQMANIYTRKMFFKFQEELWNGWMCKMVFQSYNELETNFVVHPAPRKDDDQAKKKNSDDFDKPRKVVLQNSTSHASCSCQKFEHEGIPCRHILCVWGKHAQIERMPIRFILPRWTRHAKRGDAVDKEGALVKANFDGSLVARHSILMNLAIKTAEEGSMTEESFQVAFEGLLDVNKRLRDINLNAGA